MNYNKALLLEVQISKNIWNFTQYLFVSRQKVKERKVGSSP
jgi:hypothetical protein